VRVDSVPLTRSPERAKVPRMRAPSSLRLPAALLALAAAACSPRVIPGTEIHDTQDTRRIYALVNEYRDALLRKDANAIVAMAAPDYFDAAGTPEPEDDVNRELLAQRLPEDLSKIDSMKLDVTIRKIEVQKDRAIAEIFFDGWYRVKTPAGAVARTDSDLQQLLLRKVDGKQWMFTSGL
jgi:hypothetical protein